MQLSMPLISESSSIDEARLVVNYYRQQIDSFDCVAKESVLIIDWGPQQRGQGKRTGHIIKGSMSAAPSGKKKYYGIDLSAYITCDKVKTDLKYLQESYKRVQYDKARQFGCNHIESMIYAHT